MRCFRVGLTVLMLIVLIYLGNVDGKVKKTKKKPTNETNVINFFRIFIMRLVYGFAKMFGAGEAFEDFLGGAFVPPGAEDSDYRDYLDYGKEDDEDYY